jgi:hypothetical protein
MANAAGVAQTACLSNAKVFTVPCRDGHGKVLRVRGVRGVKCQGARRRPGAFQEVNLGGCDMGPLYACKVRC